MAAVRYLFLILFPLCASLASAQQGPRESLTLAQVMLRDACLRDVEFVDPQHGWAVGDRGLVLRTTDGGRRWLACETPIDGPLYGITFVDRRHGWVVGGTTTPYTHKTRAVVLATDDGGQSWRRLPAATLPLLRGVKFFDTRRGVALGIGTVASPSGLFETDNGGRNWRPAPSDRTSAWLCGAFPTPEMGLLVGSRGAVATRGDRGLIHDELLTGDPRGMHGAALQLDRGRGRLAGWIVGDGGMVLQTTDAGRTWRPPLTTPPESAAACDFRSVSTVGEQLWIVGSPGSVVLHSPDGGSTWHWQPTGISAPLEGITMVDERHGWAVGALGTILATTDGGRTWRVQRRGGRRTSVLMVAANAEDIPLEVIAEIAAGEGHLTTIDLAFAPTHGSAAIDVRLAEATTKVGATLAHEPWRLSLHNVQKALPTESLLAALNRQTHGKAAALLQQQWVHRLRTLQPDVVLVAKQKETQTTGAERIVLDSIREAIDAAADPRRHPELADVGLGPHRVQRMATVAPTDRSSGERVVSGDFVASLGASPEMWADSSRGLLLDDYRPAATAFAYRLVPLAESTSAAAASDPLAGLAIARGKGARRIEGAAPTGKLAALRAVAQKRRLSQQLLHADPMEAADARLAKMAQLTSGLEADIGAEMLFELAGGYRDLGRLDHAAEAYYLLSRRYTDRPLADAALLWLLRYYASSEAAQAALNAANDDLAKPLANVPAGGPPAIKSRDQAEPLSRDERRDRAAMLAEYFAKARPEWLADPEMRFPIAAVNRGRGKHDEALQLVRVLTDQPVAHHWRQRATVERWLADREENPTAAPIPTTVGAIAKTRPYLDGKFDDPCWADADAIQLRDTPNGSPTGASVRFAYDNDYFYVAIECEGTATSFELDDAPRTRDADLSQHDRVTIELDIDRDYATAYRFTIDRRGWTADSCWGDRHWNPQWYVAAGNGDETRAGRWTAEVAIPLAELAESIPEGAAWAMAITRQSPNAAPQSWTGEAGDANPARFGLLILP